MNSNAEGETLYAKGCDVINPDPSGIPAAVELAKTADIVILGLGITECGSWWNSSTTPAELDCHNGSPELELYGEAEGHDRTSIDLPPVQRQLASEILALGKSVIIFLLNGGMVNIEPEMKAGATVIEAFYPGQQGGHALSLALFGHKNVWGKMPYTVYAANWTKTNSMLDHDVTHNRTYRYGAKAVIPFGHGLSLTTFELALGSAKGLQLETTDASSVLQVQVTVINSGSRMGDEVCMAFLLPQHVALKQHPVKSLFDFQRVHDLQPGQNKTLSFRFTRESVLLANQDGSLVSAPGYYLRSFENGAGQVKQVPLVISGEQTTVHPFPQPEE